MEYSKIIAEAKERFSNPYPQNFPLPWHLMKYIQKEWSLEVYEKLTRTCKHFYASQPWMVIDFSEDYSNFRRILNEGLESNFKIWVVRRSTEEQLFWNLGDLTSEARFFQLLHSIRFTAVKNLSIDNRKLSYSDYIAVSNFESVKTLILTSIGVTTKDDANKICLLDDLLKPLKNVRKFQLFFENNSNFYLKSAKRLADFVVPQSLQEITLIGIPEYISFEYFHQFLKKNPSMTFLRLHFRSADENNTFISDVQSYYSEDLTYETTDSIINNVIFKSHFNILIGNLKIEGSFYKICKSCNQGVANKVLRKRFCPSNVMHWICKDCFAAFQPGGPCPFCPAEV